MECSKVDGFWEEKASSRRFARKRTVDAPAKTAEDSLASRCNHVFRCGLSQHHLLCLDRREFVVPNVWSPDEAWTRAQPRWRLVFDRGHGGVWFLLSGHAPPTATEREGTSETILIHSSFP